MAPLHAARHKSAVASRLLIAAVIAAVVLSVGWLAVARFAVGGGVDASNSSARLTSASPTSSPATWPAASAGRAPARWALHRQRSQPPPSQRPLPRRAERWQSVLQLLDRVRAKAWRQVSPTLLRRVYLPSTPEAQRDLSMLRQYAERGLSVEGVRLAFGAVIVARRTPQMVRLRVIDQLREATAVDQRGRRLKLPRDSPTRHTIELRRSAGSWRIAEVQLR